MDMDREGHPVKWTMRMASLDCRTWYLREHISIETVDAAGIGTEVGMELGLGRRLGLRSVLGLGLGELTFNELLRRQKTQLTGKLTIKWPIHVEIKCFVHWDRISR